MNNIHVIAYINHMKLLKVSLVSYTHRKHLPFIETSQIRLWKLLKCVTWLHTKYIYLEYRPIYRPRDDMSAHIDATKRYGKILQNRIVLNKIPVSRPIYRYIGQYTGISAKILNNAYHHG